MFWLGLCIGLVIGVAGVVVLLYQNRKLRAVVKQKQETLKQTVQEIREDLKKEL